MKNNHLETLKELAIFMDKYRPSPWKIGETNAFVWGSFVESANKLPVCGTANKDLQNYILHCDPKNILSLIHAVEISIDAFHWAGKWTGKRDGALQEAYNNVEKELGNIHG